MSAPTGPWLVVGLGNPGAPYAGNRHNVGQMVLDELARRAGTAFTSPGGAGGRRPQAVVADVRLGVLPGGAPGPRAVLAKPTTYMNVSGGPVVALARYHDIPPERVVMVHDELDIPFADVRLKKGGGEGGHNGLRDTSRALGTKDYVRVRVGIGRPPGRMDPADYVLRDFATAERGDLGWLVDRAADAVEAVVLEGLERAQGRFHTKP
ncbi:aminoacyl-tRNA hydrolase [Cellulomonas marina]|uniref:Peptidyl-tRNA hydrolase n=1 Tax=Cellulomonas marina TaxID=988821 RepID=A0A1I0X720_9CELL|nr:aminoacyl-tRNA hydrolase [Cellulomonas marina]GIG28939.1 peptidyl-tRNA hydrolase [Cellulomonas marina]SFA95823.1 peptidyl-tRNA hydrolase, PTH1 family [Cellulomonas marina]